MRKVDFYLARNTKLCNITLISLNAIFTVLDLYVPKYVWT